VKENIIIPIFPLNGIIFFPGTNLPLNIFEPRYLALVDYALDRDSKIGMIQQQEYGALYSVGCMGKITSCKKTSDGRYLINLMGQNCFDIKNEVELKKKFRLAEVRVYSNQNKKKDLHFDKPKTSELLREYEKFMKHKGLEVNLDYFKQVEKTNIIKFIAMTAPFSSAEKQMLLETISFKELFDKLITLLQYYNLVGSNSIN
jgi:Lon protease-like protein